MEPCLIMKNDDGLQHQTRRFETNGLPKSLKCTIITLSCSSDTNIKELHDQFSFMIQKGGFHDLSPSWFSFEFPCFNKLLILLKLVFLIGEMCQRYESMSHVITVCEVLWCPACIHCTVIQFVANIAVRTTPRKSSSQAMSAKCFCFLQ